MQILIKEPLIKCARLVGANLGAHVGGRVATHHAVMKRLNHSLLKLTFIKIRKPKFALHQ